MSTNSPQLHVQGPGQRRRLRRQRRLVQGQGLGRQLQRRLRQLDLEQYVSPHPITILTRQKSNTLPTGSYSFDIPSCVPDGEYLVRIQQLGIHNPWPAGIPQFYISCAQVKVTGGGSGNPGPTVSIPGAFKATDPGYTANVSLAPCPLPNPPTLPSHDRILTSVFPTNRSTPTSTATRSPARPSSPATAAAPTPTPTRIPSPTRPRPR